MPFPLFGAVFYDPNFRFKDGEVSDKLFVILALSPAKDYVVARTTSSQDRKSWTYGCHNDDPYPNFFIPAAINIFPKDTWVCLDYLAEFDQADFQKRVAANSLIQKNQLPQRLLRDLLDCAASAEGTTIAQEKVLRDTLSQLPTKF